jgi:hypothetical protein
MRIAGTAHMLSLGYRVRAIAAAHDAVGIYAQAMITSASAGEYQRIGSGSCCRESEHSASLGALIKWRGRKVELRVVELRGFEPLTPSMRTRCATGLRHSPEYRVWALSGRRSG